MVINMLVTEIYNGQGLGNQLHCYITTRVLALDNNYDFGIMNYQKFKCLDFLDLDFGKKVIEGEGPEGGPPIKLPESIEHYYKERYNIHPNGSNITIDDPFLNNIKDNTKIDGILQSENQIYHRKNEIKKWLKVKQDYNCYDYSNDDICIINFRGGEYVYHPNFFLRSEYWEYAISYMKKINPNFKFIVISDDPITAKRFFPDFDVFHFSIGKDYSIIKNARYLILSNSSFPYFATLTSETIKHIIAPKYWGRHNISDGYWSCGYNIYRNFNYIDRESRLFSYNECLDEFNKYTYNNKTLFYA